MKKLLIIAIIIPSLSFSQEVISSQGDSYSNGNGSVDFTIGELVIDTGTDGNNIITQGFHQTNWRFVGLENHFPSIEVSVFPNPVKEQLNIETSNFEGMNYRMYDASGKIVLEGNLTQIKTQVETGNLTPSTYSLVIQNLNKEKIKTFKLIKTN